MAKHGNWTVIFDDEAVVKRTEEFGMSDARGYSSIGSTDFWNQAKFSNIHAIQFSDDGNNDNDQVEFKDNSPNGPYTSELYGSFQQFIDLWDAAHLMNMQENWDNDTQQVEDPANSGNYRDETDAEKTTRLGARPTSYSSSVNLNN
tara:strand:- start:622 stop:1059 length:438 start_codon:yes stop_codon:yes gene_type:complete